MNDNFVPRMLADLLEAGLSRGQIARHLGVHHSAVSRWASGERRATGYTTFRLARLHRALTGSASLTPAGAATAGEAGVAPAGDAA